MTAHGLFSKSLAVAAIIGTLALFGSAAPAADIGDKDLKMDQVYYQPALMPSVQDAVTALNALHSSYSDWRGGLPEGVYATPAMVQIHTNIHESEDGSQWVPNWGGSFVGGSYVPYMGGSMQSTHSESDHPADVSVIPSEITAVTLWSYPNLERDFKFGFDLQKSKSVISFRTSNIDVARQLANAFATLAAANFTDGRRFSPFLGIRMQTKDLPSQYTRLNWTGSPSLLIDTVLDNSPAQAAGLAHDDIVAEANGKPVADASSLGKIATEFLGKNPSGLLDLKIFRGGQTIPLQVAITNPNAGMEKLLPAPALIAAPAAAAPVHLGIAARNLTAAEAKKAGIASGILIVGVDAGSLGAQMEMKPGDFLLEINGTKLVDMNTMKQALSAGSVETAKVWRKGKVLTLNGVSKL